MPKRMRQQRRGKGTAVFRAPSFKFKYKARYRTFDEAERENMIEGVVEDIVNDTARSAPIMIIRYKTGEYATLPAPYGMKVGDAIAAGAKAVAKLGNTLPLKSIPTGTDVYNLELAPGDGGKVVKAAGTFAKIVSHERNGVIIKLPSKQFKTLNPDCRATIGVTAGFGRTEKPIVKAGKHWHMMRARGRYWPMTAAVVMNRVTHPFGGKRRSTQKKLKTISRRMPRGARYGSIAARRTGRGGRK